MRSDPFFVVLRLGDYNLLYMWLHCCDVRWSLQQAVSKSGELTRRLAVYTELRDDAAVGDPAPHHGAAEPHLPAHGRAAAAQDTAATEGDREM